MRAVLLLGFVAIAVLLFPLGAAAQVDDDVYVEDVEDPGYAEIYIQRYQENCRVLIEMRRIFEALGWTVEWTPKGKRIDAYHTEESGYHLTMWINKRRAIVNDADFGLDVPPRLVWGLTYVPLRFVAEVTGCQVDYLVTAVQITARDGSVLMVNLIED